MYPRDQYWFQSCSTSSLTIYLDDGAECSKLAGDTKLGGVSDTLEGCAAIQKDLNSPEKWADRSLMKFNKGKCKVPLAPSATTRHQYMLMGRLAGKQVCRKGPGGPGGHQDEHEPEMCPCVKKG